MDWQMIGVGVALFLGLAGIGVGVYHQKRNEQIGLFNLRSGLYSDLRFLSVYTLIYDKESRQAEAHTILKKLSYGEHQLLFPRGSETFQALIDLWELIKAEDYVACLRDGFKQEIVEQLDKCATLIVSEFLDLEPAISKLWRTIKNTCVGMGG